MPCFGKFELFEKLRLQKTRQKKKHVRNQLTLYIEQIIFLLLNKTQDLSKI